MDKKILELLKKDCKTNGYDVPDNEDDYFELLREYDIVHKEEISQHRWWNEYRYVIMVGSTYIGYVYAETTGDMNPTEAGYDFESDSICEMKPIQKTITTYIKK